MICFPPTLTHQYPRRKVQRGFHFVKYIAYFFVMKVLMKQNAVFNSGILEKRFKHKDTGSNSNTDISVWNFIYSKGQYGKRHNARQLLILNS